MEPRRSLAALALAALALAAACSSAHAQIAAACLPTAGVVVPVFGLFEARFGLVGGLPPGVNPFNVSQARATMRVTGPSAPAGLNIAGFWFANFSRALVDGTEVLTPLGPPDFVARFAPTVPGAHSYSVSLSLGGAPAVAGPTCAFAVQPSSDPGFIRPGPNNQTFAFDDGSDYFAVGENLAWDSQALGTFQFDAYFANLSDVGGNYVRLWLTDAWDVLFLETALGSYSLENAWRLDTVLASARSANIRALLTIESFNLFCDDPPPDPCSWSVCVYNAANGGPLAAPADFFSDAAAVALFQQRLAYLTARWAFSPAVLAWEFWNEGDLTQDFNLTQHAQWIATMTAFVRAHDPNAHMVSTSFSGQDPAYLSEVFAQPGLSFSSVHTYSSFSATDQFANCAYYDVRNAALLPGKPTFVEETGILGGDGPQSGAVDPTGISLHNALWSGIVAGGAGTAMNWWWDLYVMDDDLYGVFVGAARLARSVRWGAAVWAVGGGSFPSAALPPAPGGNASLAPAVQVWTRMGVGFAGAPQPAARCAPPTALVWLYDTQCAWFAAWLGVPCLQKPATPAGTGATLSLPLNAAGCPVSARALASPSVAWFNTTTGALLAPPAPSGQCSVAGANATCTGVAVPSFWRDVVGVLAW
jgi:hypothetical protein